MERKRFLLDFDSSLRFRKYADFSENDQTRLKDILRGRAKVELVRGDRFNLTLLDEYERVAIDPRDPLVEESDLINQTNRNRLAVIPSYSFQRKTWSGSLRYIYENLWYEQSDADDSDSHQIGFDLRKNLPASLDVFIAIWGEERNVRERQDYRRADLSGGFSWERSSRLSITAGGGVGWIDFTEDASPGSDESDGSHKTVNWNIEGKWQVRPNLSALILYTEVIDLSVDEGAFESRNAEAVLNYGRRVSTRLRFNLQENDYFNTNRRDRIASAALGIAIPFEKSWTLGMDAMVARSDFHPGDEDLWRYNGTVALQYGGRVFSASGGYTINIQDSDLNGNDFTNNILYLNGGIRF